jgi:hypothetical protein
VEFVACFLVINSLAWENKSHGKMTEIIFIFKEEKCLAQCQGFTINVTMTAYEDNFSSRLTVGSCN